MPTPRRRKCKHCKSPLPPSSTGRPRVYCSAACRQAAWRRSPRRDPMIRAIQGDIDFMKRRKAALRNLQEAARVYESLHPHHRVIVVDRNPGEPLPERARPVLNLVHSKQDGFKS